MASLKSIRGRHCSSTRFTCPRECCQSPSSASHHRSLIIISTIMSDYHSKYHCPFDWNSMYAESGHFASAPTMAPSAHNPCAYDASTGRSAFYQHPYQPPIGPFGHSFTQQLNISPDAVHLSHHSAPFSGSSIKSSPTDSGLGYSPTLFQSSPDHFTRSPQHSLPPTADCFSSSTVLPNHAQKMEASSSEIALPSIVHPFKSEKESKSSRQGKSHNVFWHFFKRQ